MGGHVLVFWASTGVCVILVDTHTYTHRERENVCVCVKVKQHLRYTAALTALSELPVRL